MTSSASGAGTQNCSAAVAAAAAAAVAAEHQIYYQHSQHLAAAAAAHQHQLATYQQQQLNNAAVAAAVSQLPSSLAPPPPPYPRISPYDSFYNSIDLQTAEYLQHMFSRQALVASMVAAAGNSNVANAGNSTGATSNSMLNSTSSSVSSSMPSSTATVSNTSVLSSADTLNQTLAAAYGNNGLIGTQTESSAAANASSNVLCTPTFRTPSAGSQIMGNGFTLNSRKRPISVSPFLDHFDVNTFIRQSPLLLSSRSSSAMSGSFGHSLNAVNSILRSPLGSGTNTPNPLTAGLAFPPYGSPLLNAPGHSAFSPHPGLGALHNSGAGYFTGTQPYPSYYLGNNKIDLRKSGNTSPSSQHKSQSNGTSIVSSTAITSVSRSNPTTNMFSGSTVELSPVSNSSSNSPKYKSEISETASNVVSPTVPLLDQKIKRESSYNISEHGSPGEPLDDDHDDGEESLFRETVCKWTDCNGGNFELPDNLVKHINDVHICKTDKGFVCQWPDCTRQQKPFKAMYMLKIHVRSHTGEKPHVCDNEKCGKRYSRLENLKTHKRVHTGERPYRCEHPGCAKCFSNASDRAKHQNRTHTNDKPYECHYEGCAKKYTDPSSLRKHVKTVHGEEAYKNKRHKGISGNCRNNQKSLQSQHKSTTLTVHEQSLQSTLPQPPPPLSALNVKQETNILSPLSQTPLTHAITQSIENQLHNFATASHNVSNGSSNGLISSSAATSGSAGAGSGGGGANAHLGQYSSGHPPHPVQISRAAQDDGATGERMNGLHSSSNQAAGPSTSSIRSAVEHLHQAAHSAHIPHPISSPFTSISYSYPVPCSTSILPNQQSNISQMHSINQSYPHSYHDSNSYACRPMLTNEQQQMSSLPISENQVSTTSSIKDYHNDGWNAGSAPSGLATARNTVHSYCSSEVDEGIGNDSTGLAVNDDRLTELDQDESHIGSTNSLGGEGVYTVSTNGTQLLMAGQVANTSSSGCKSRTSLKNRLRNGIRNATNWIPTIFHKPKITTQVDDLSPVNGQVNTGYTDSRYEQQHSTSSVTTTTNTSTQIDQKCGVKKCLTNRFSPFDSEPTPAVSVGSSAPCPLNNVTGSNADESGDLYDPISTDGSSSRRSSSVSTGSLPISNETVESSKCKTSIAHPNQNVRLEECDSDKPIEQVPHVVVPDDMMHFLKQKDDNHLVTNADLPPGPMSPSSAMVVVPMSPQANSNGSVSTIQPSTSSNSSTLTPLISAPCNLPPQQPFSPMSDVASPGQPMSQNQQSSPPLSASATATSTENSLPPPPPYPFNRQTLCSRSVMQTTCASNAASQSSNKNDYSLSVTSGSANQHAQHLPPTYQIAQPPPPSYPGPPMQPNTANGWYGPNPIHPTGFYSTQSNLVFSGGYSVNYSSYQSNYGQIQTQNAYNGYAQQSQPAMYQPTGSAMSGCSGYNGATANYSNSGWSNTHQPLISPNAGYSQYNYSNDYANQAQQNKIKGLDANNNAKFGMAASVVRRCSENEDYSGPQLVTPAPSSLLNRSSSRMSITSNTSNIANARARSVIGSPMQIVSSFTPTPGMMADDGTSNMVINDMNSTLNSLVEETRFLKMSIN